MQNNKNKPASSARKSRGPSRQNGGVSNRLQKAPLAQSRVRVGTMNPKNVVNAKGSRVIVFEEYVQDIITSSTTLEFNVQRFQVQPGLQTLFAWLAEQAINFQEYRFRKLAFRFETDQQASIAGKVMYAFSPDAADPLPLNKQEMLEYGTKGKSAVWQEFRLPIPLDEALGRKRYVRSGNLSANLDIKTYDFGALFVASSGIVATSANIGELYVEYEIELMVPVVQSLGQAQARSVTVTGASSVSETAPFGLAPTYVGGLDVVAGSTGAGLVFNRVGYYLVQMNVVGTALNTVYAPTGVITSGSGSVTQIPGISNAAANAGTEAWVSFAVIISSRGTIFAPSLQTQGTTITAAVARITQFSAA